MWLFFRLDGPNSKRPVNKWLCLKSNQVNVLFTVQLQKSVLRYFFFVKYIALQIDHTYRYYVFGKYVLVRPSYIMTVKISPIIITVTIISIYLPATIGPWGYTMFFSKVWFEKKNSTKVHPTETRFSEILDLMNKLQLPSSYFAILSKLDSVNLLDLVNKRGLTTTFTKSSIFKN